MTLADGVAHDATTGAGAVSVSASGQVAYRTGGNSRRQLVWVDRSGKALGVLGAPDESSLTAPSVSPDGNRAAVFRTVEGNADIWLVAAARTTRLTFDAGLDRYPIWSTDGSRITFDSNRTGKRNLYQKLASGVGAEELLVESQEDKVANDWSPDGQFLSYFSIQTATARDLWVWPMQGDRKPWEFLKTRFEERFGVFSPDGRWMAYMSNESGRDEVYIRPFAPAASTSAGGQWQVSTAGGIFPRWRHDGKELYYVGPNGEMTAVPVEVNGTTLEPGAPVTLFTTRIYGGGVDIQLARQYDVTRDGRFLINTVLNDAFAPITLLMNWDPDAKR
jgi:Tol biopolymer transport system component